MNILEQSGSILLDLVFPKTCLGCWKIGSYFCGGCASEVPLQMIQRCIVCQKPALEGFTHPKCAGKHKPDRLFSLYNYQSRPISNLIITGKYHFIPEIYQLLGTRFAEFLLNSPISINEFVVCPIPLSKQRERWRSFNQSNILAEQLSITKLNLLARSKNTKTQKELNKLQRLHNLKNAFQFIGDQIPEKVILIDDVVTTGATFLEATAMLKQAGVRQVWCFAIAQD